MDENNLVCIKCPIGCRMTIIKDKNEPQGYKILGNKCKRGSEYALIELMHPMRMLTTTVRVENGFLKRLPVKSSNPLPKELVLKCMPIINRVTAHAPIKLGDVLVENILDTGINIIATRSMNVK